MKSNEELKKNKIQDILHTVLFACKDDEGDAEIDITSIYNSSDKILKLFKSEIDEVAQYKEEVERLKRELYFERQLLDDLSMHLNLKEGESIICKVKEMEGRIDYLENKDE